MQKKVIPLLLAMALCLSLLGPAAQGVTYEDIYFMALNDSIYPAASLSAESMPVRNGGILYVPYTMFDANYTGTDLGVLYNYNRELSAFTLYQRQKMLVFHINDGTCDDGQAGGNSYSYRVIARNGKIYLPVEFVCSFFDLTYSLFTVTAESGTVKMVRVRSDLTGLSDVRFASAATFLVGNPLNEYLKSQSTPPPPVSTPAATPVPVPTPVAPTPTPPRPSATVSAAPEPSPGVTEEPVDKSDVTVSFAIRCTDGGGFPALTGVLAAGGVPALFLFRPEELAGRDDDVRMLLAQGHQVGLLLDPEDSAAQFEVGNDLLAHIARTDARMVAMTDGSGTSNKSWTAWTDNTGNVTGPTGSAAQADLALRQIEKKRSQARVTLDDSTQSASTLSRILTKLVEDKYTLRPPSEITLP